MANSRVDMPIIRSNIRQMVQRGMESECLFEPCCIDSRTLWSFWRDITARCPVNYTVTIEIFLMEAFGDLSICLRAYITKVRVACKLRQYSCFDLTAARCQAISATWSYDALRPSGKSYLVSETTRRSPDVDLMLQSGTPDTPAAQRHPILRSHLIL